MISKDKKRFTITFNVKHYEMLKELAKECNCSLSKVLESMFILAVLLNAKEEEEKENENKN